MTNLTTNPRDLSLIVKIFYEIMTKVQCFHSPQFTAHYTKGAIASICFEYHVFIWCFFPKLCHHFLYTNGSNRHHQKCGYFLWSWIFSVIYFITSAWEFMWQCFKKIGGLLSFYFGQSVQWSWSVHEARLAPQCKPPLCRCIIHTHHHLLP